MKKLALAFGIWLALASGAFAQTNCLVPSTFPGTPVVTTTLEGSHVLKASPGCLISAYVYNAGTAAFFMVFNATTLPANGAVAPLECIPVAAASYQYLNFAPQPPEFYSTGITTAISTGANCLTLTVGSGAWFHALVQ